jgi:hypothetical protein
MNLDKSATRISPKNTLPEKIRKLKAIIRSKLPPKEIEKAERQLKALTAVKENVAKKEASKPLTTAQLLKQLREKGYKIVKNPSGSMTITKIGVKRNTTK